MNPIPTLPTSDINREFLLDAPQKFSDSYIWLIQQYDNKCKRLADYASRPQHSQKYVLYEKAFLISLYRHLQIVKKHSECSDFFFKETHFTAGKAIILLKILAIYGISSYEIEKYYVNEKMLDEDLKIAKDEKKILLPISINKHFKKIL